MITASLLIGAGWVSALLHAQTIKEGRLEFDICKFGKADYPLQARSLIEESFQRIAAFIYDGRRTDIDRQDSRCAATYEVVDGEYRDHGVCTELDADGDQWLMRYQTGADLGGTWVAASGSGKYSGMTAQGEYKPVNNIPGVIPNGFKNCNHYTGTYKLQ
jgi:hypothetical protein